MHEHEREAELTALWAEICASEGGDVDEALRAAGAELDDLLAFAAAWDSDAEAMRDTAQARIAPYKPACAA